MLQRWGDSLVDDFAGAGSSHSLELIDIFAVADDVEIDYPDPANWRRQVVGRLGGWRRRQAVRVIWSKSL